MRTLITALLALACVAASHYWWRRGQPVEIADAPAGSIACVSYTPFRKGGETPFDKLASVSPQRIEEDLRALAQRFDCVRTYSTSQGLDAVPRIAQGLGMKVLLGIWIGRERVDNERELELGLRAAREHRDAIRAVIVGNEVLLRRELPPAALAKYIRRVRAATTLPVTYGDVWEFWLKHPEMAEAVSFVTVHILPYWEDKPVAVEHAVEHIRQVYALVRDAFPGKEVLIGETGWPSAGRQRRGAVPSRVNEARLIREFLAFAEKSRVPYNVIEAFDQPWKRRLEGTVGGYWGLYDGNLQEKFPLQGPVVEDPGWRGGIYAGVGLALAFALVPLTRRRRSGLPGSLVLLLGGYATGAALAAQARYLVASNRHALDWAVTGTYTLLEFITAFALAGAIARWADRREPLPVPGSLADGWRNLARIFHQTGPKSNRTWRQIIIPRSGETFGPGGSAWLGVLRFAWAFGAAVVGLLLTFDPRYRDFPLPLFAPPVAGFALLAAIALAEGAAKKAGLEERLLAGWLALSAPVIVAMERPSNGSALAWAGLSLLLAAAVLIPDRLARRRG